MELDLTFKAVCASLKDGAKQDPKVLDAIDKLLGLAIMCAPVVLGPAALALLPTLSVKNELVKIGKSVFQSATKKSAHDDYFARLERMRTAHGLLVYTAFFDALDQLLPAKIRKRIDVNDEKRRLVAAKAEALEGCATDGEEIQEHATPSEEANPLAEVAIPFPHPTESFVVQLKRHEPLWKLLSQGFWNFLQMLAVWDELSEEERKELRKTLDGLPSRAAEQFEAQFLTLAKTYGDFAVWVNLHEHAATQEELGQLARDVTKLLALASESGQSVDLGLSKLHDAIAELPTALAQCDADGIVASLAKYYRARLDDPIIEDKDGPSTEGPRLRFPKVQEAFIPQSFRVVRQMAEALHLESEDTWKVLDRRDDLGSFLMRYLSSPYSVDAPLLVLGHPGSGKSLLTTVLAAQLAARNYSVVRVPLREVRADVGIDAQIEEAIRQVTRISVDSWARLSARFKDYPPVVILDGYDELLQASGRVYAGYLSDAKKFQRLGVDLGRPVRVIVTSRVTLIDKAKVPEGATVLRLLEFDDSRQKNWISGWNQANASYFREAKLEPFRLPKADDPGAEKILLLAEQPLLLLMLALYDSEDNQLRDSLALDRTRLYNELLRRFVKRERRKDPKFDDDLTDQEQEKEIEADMRRLGVAAIGMYNRRQVHVLAKQLESDLSFFGMQRSVAVPEGKPMSQADLLLGSFFFVHKSQARSGPDGDGAAELTAFEFMHNTLGEFLTADFILRWAIKKVKELATLESMTALQAKYHETITSVDGLGRQWFASLVYTPLFTRPVVLEMMREWSGHLVAEVGMTRDEFAGNLDTVLHHQLERLISKRAMPSIMQQETVEENYRAQFGDHPLVGHVAVYSLNLVLLRVIVGDRPFVFDEASIESYEDGARPWDRLVHLWRSWFSLEALNGLTAALETTRDGGRIEVRAKKSFQVAEGRGQLEVLLNVSLAIGDDLTSAAAGLAHTEDAASQRERLDEIGRCLKAERISSGFQLAVRHLQVVVRRGPDDVRELLRYASEAMEQALEEDPEDKAERVAALFAAGVRRFNDDRSEPSFAFRSRPDESVPPPELRRALDGQLIAGLLRVSPEAALEWIRALKALVGRVRFHMEIDEVLERTLRGDPRVLETFRRRPTSALAWAQVIRELGLAGLFRSRPHGRALDRMFQARMLADLAEHHPEAALMLMLTLLDQCDYVDVERFWHRAKLEFIPYLIDPSHLLALAKLDLTVAQSAARLLREWQGGRLLVEIHPEAGSRLVDNFFGSSANTTDLFKLFDYSPATGLELFRIVRMLSRDRPVRDVHPRVVKRFMHPRFLVHLAERSPEAAIALVEYFADASAGVPNFGRNFGPDFAERMFDPRLLLDVAERSPEAASTIARLWWRWSQGGPVPHLGPEWANGFVEAFFKRAMETPYLERLVDRNPATAAKLFRLVRAMLREGSPDSRPRLDPHLADFATDPTLLMRLSERGPDAAWAMIDLLREVSGDRPLMLRSMRPKVLDRLLDPRYLLELSERSAELALACEEFGRELLDEHRGRHHRARRLAARTEGAIQDWLATPGRGHGGLVLALRLVRRLETKETIEALGRVVVDMAQHFSLERVLPLAVVGDLLWLAESQSDPHLRDVIQSIIPIAGRQLLNPDPK